MYPALSAATVAGITTAAVTDNATFNEILRKYGDCESEEQLAMAYAYFREWRRHTPFLSMIDHKAAVAGMPRSGCLARVAESLECQQKNDTMSAVCVTVTHPLIFRAGCTVLPDPAGDGN